MNEPHFKTLKRMIGKPWLYRGNQITIENYHIMGDQGKTQIDVVGKDPIEVKDIKKFIEACLPVEDDKPVRNGQTAALSTEVVEQTNGLLSSLQQTLLDNIAAVKKDPAYIKQANTINSSVNSLIGLAKIQIQVGKMKAAK